MECVDSCCPILPRLNTSRWPNANYPKPGDDRYDHHSVTGLSGVCGNHCGLWHLGIFTGRYETWRVAPLSLLVPVVGLASAAVLLDETLTGLQLLGALLIMAGLYINVFGFRLRKTARARG